MTGLMATTKPDPVKILNTAWVGYTQRHRGVPSTFIVSKEFLQDFREAITGHTRPLPESGTIASKLRHYRFRSAIICADPRFSGLEMLVAGIDPQPA